MGKIIGIDLGTTNSAVAYMVAGKPEVIAEELQAGYTLGGQPIRHAMVKVTKQ